MSYIKSFLRSMSYLTFSKKNRHKLSVTRIATVMPDCSLLEIYLQISLKLFLPIHCIFPGMPRTKLNLLDFIKFIEDDKDGTCTCSYHW